MARTSDPAALGPLFSREAGAAKRVRQLGTGRQVAAKPGRRPLVATLAAGDAVSVAGRQMAAMRRAAHFLRPEQAAQQVAHLWGLAGRAQSAATARLSTRDGTQQLAVGLLLASPGTAPALLQRLVQAGILSAQHRDLALQALPPRQRLPLADLARQLSLALPPSVALFLAKQRLLQGQVVLDLLYQWAESLREEAARAKVNEKRRHEGDLVAKQHLAQQQQQAKARSRQLQQAVEAASQQRHAELVRMSVADLRTAARVGGLGEDLVLRRQQAAPARPFAAESLTSPMPNRFLMGALDLPTADAVWRMSGPQSSVALRILQRGLAFVTA